jgi:rSAM/selenodomain-associated transferase 2
MNISVIIPTKNEAQHLGELIDFIKLHGIGYISEIIVVDGISSDNTIFLAEAHKAVVLISPVACRAAQMNLGAKHAIGDLLYFVHADVQLIPSFVEDILAASKKGYLAGCFRFQFDSNSLLLKFNGYMTRFSPIMCRGGDQTLFIQKQFFEELGGFDEKYVLMEEYDLIRKIRRTSRFFIIPKSITVSARKYLLNSWFRVQIVNLLVFILFFLSVSPKRLKILYSKWLHF